MTKDGPGKKGSPFLSVLGFITVILVSVGYASLQHHADSYPVAATVTQFFYWALHGVLYGVLGSFVITEIVAFLYWWKRKPQQKGNESAGSTASIVSVVLLFSLLSFFVGNFGASANVRVAPGRATGISMITLITSPSMVSYGYDFGAIVGSVLWCSLLVPSLLFRRDHKEKPGEKNLDVQESNQAAGGHVDDSQHRNDGRGVAKSQPDDGAVTKPPGE